MTDFKWSDEAVTELKRLWADGLSASKCADDLQAAFGGSPTRSSVLGKINRLGLSEPRSKRNATPTSKKKKRERKTVTLLTNHGRRYDVLELNKPELVVNQLSADDIPLSQRKQLLDLQPEDCRWPYNDPGKPDFFFCGAVKSSGRPYCAYHAAVARGEGPRSLSDAERDRRRRHAVKLNHSAGFR